MIEAATISPQLLEQTRQRIEGDLSELSRLAQSEHSAPKFYNELLQRVIAALAAVDGAIWTLDRQQGARVAFRAGQNPEQTLAEMSPAETARLKHVREVLDTRRPLITQLAVTDDTPNSKAAGSPMLLLSPIPGRQGPLGVLEIQQRGNASKATQQGNIRFCQKAAAIAADFEHARRLALLERDHQTNRQITEFLAAIHGSLSVKETATRIANEARRMADVDRVTVLLRDGNRYAVEAISGAESFNRRSEAIVALKRLAEKCTATGEPAHWDKTSGEADDALPARVRTELAAYAEKHSLAAVTVVPLDGVSAKARNTSGETGKTKKRHGSADAPRSGKPAGIAIIEQAEPRLERERLEARVSVVREHGGQALSNAIRHENSILLPWRRAKAGSSAVSRTRILPRWLLVLILLGGASTALALIPARFKLEARGTLEPITRRDVFAANDGVVQKVLVKHGDRVSQGQILAELTDDVLEMEMATKQGDLAATIERQTAVRDALLSSTSLHPAQRDQLRGEQEQLDRTKESLERQLQILQGKLERTRLASPIAGEVVTWDVDDLLMYRHVRRGQRLLSVADPAGDWELELQLPEVRLGHLLAAGAESHEDVRVEFMLATEPGVTYEGRITEIHRRAEVSGPEGNTVLVKVAVDRDQLDQLHPGASVVAQFDCGERSLGYVLFHDVVEFAQRKILFRF